jgi:hypothetical protein
MSELTTYQHHYGAFGLNILSDLLLPELPAHASGDLSPSPAHVTASNHQDWPPLMANEHSTPSLQMATGDWRLELEGIGWFRAQEGETLSYERWDDSVSDRDLRTFLVTSGLAALLIQRGALVLQGTTLVRNGQAVMLLGTPASGKSTLACCLQQDGWQLLSSELSVMNEQGLVWPGLQQLKLWHDSAAALGLDWAQLPLVRRGLKRYALLPPEAEVSFQAAPLEMIYILSRRNSKKDAQESEIQTRRLERQAVALLRLRNNAYQPRVYRGMDQEANLFLQASALARRVPIYSLQLSDGVKPMQQALEKVDLLAPSSLEAEPTVGLDASAEAQEEAR